MHPTAYRYSDRYIALTVQPIGAEEIDILITPEVAERLEQDLRWARECSPPALMPSAPPRLSGKSEGTQP